MKRIIPTIVFALSIALGVTAFAQTTQPEAEQPSTTVWTNLSPTDIGLYIGAWAAAITTVIVLGTGIVYKLIEAWFGGKKLIAEKQRELEAQIKTVAQATSTLADANQQNPASRDIDPAIDARVRAIATGTGDGNSVQ